MTAPTVIREDLTRRSPLLLSKSALVAFDLCAPKSFYAIHDPRPFIVTPKMVFGSAVDAAIEKVGEFLRSGQDVAEDVALAAAGEVAERDEVDVDLDEVDAAVHAFLRDVAPRYDWAYSAFQRTLRMTVEGLGECDGHPDVILTSGCYDVKTAEKSKPANAAMTSVELAFYGLLIEQWTNEPVGKLGYWTWVRVAKPYWQIVETVYSDEMRRWVREVATAYVRSRNADAVLSAKALRDGTPVQNWTFNGRPKFNGLCDGCQWAPANGGSCPIALQQVELVAA